MPKFCIACRTELPDRAKFCNECGESQEAGDAQSVSVGGDVGGDVAVAGRDVIKATTGKLRECAHCKGKGVVEAIGTCSGCHGKGFTVELISTEEGIRIAKAETRLEAEELIERDRARGNRLPGFDEIYYRGFYPLVINAKVRCRHWQGVCRMITSCILCGGDGTRGMADADAIPRIKPNGLYEIMSDVDARFVRCRMGSGETSISGTCPHCKGQGQVRV